MPKVQQSEDYRNPKLYMELGLLFPSAGFTVTVHQSCGYYPNPKNREWKWIYFASSSISTVILWSREWELLWYKSQVEAPLVNPTSDQENKPKEMMPNLQRTFTN